MECEYLKAIRSKYSTNLIKAFHIVTKGVIYCPICQTTHDFKEVETNATLQKQEVLDGRDYGNSCRSERWS
jgi:hypothetical protein